MGSRHRWVFEISFTSSSDYCKRIWISNIIVRRICSRSVLASDFFSNVWHCVVIGSLTRSAQTPFFSPSTPFSSSWFQKMSSAVGAGTMELNFIYPHFLSFFFFQRLILNHPGSVYAGSVVASTLSLSLRGLINYVGIWSVQDLELVLQLTLHEYASLFVPFLDLGCGFL